MRALAGTGDPSRIGRTEQNGAVQEPEPAGRTMRVVGAPAFRNRATNPYNALLYGAVARAGVTVEEASPRTLLRLLRAERAVLHVHWPEYLFDAPRLATAVARSIAFALVVGGAKARGTKLVWTIHNVRAHETWHARLAAKMWRWFAGRVDGYIALTAGGRAAALERFPALRERPGFVIPHGHYRDAYPGTVTRAAARAALGLPPEARVVGFLGSIRPYKNVPGLIDAFRLAAGSDWRLVVAGHPTTEHLRRRLEDRARGDGRIRLDLGFVPDERVAVYLRAADLLVFPYHDILNSGSAILALSFGRPVLVPERGAMAELRETVGGEWVRTYRGDLDAPALREAVAWAEETPRHGARLLRDLDWDGIGQQTVLAYRTVMRSSPIDR